MQAGYIGESLCVIVLFTAVSRHVSQVLRIIIDFGGPVDIVILNLTEFVSMKANF